MLSDLQCLEFLRLEQNVEVFRNKKTGQEVYIGRTSTPVDAMFRTASEVAPKHSVHPGAPACAYPICTVVAEKFEAMESLGAGEQPLRNRYPARQAAIATRIAVDNFANPDAGARGKLRFLPDFARKCHPDE